MCNIIIDEVSVETACRGSITILKRRGMQRFEKSNDDVGCWKEEREDSG